MASAASKQVHRVTLFKIPEPKDIQAVLDKYTTLGQDAKKNGQPYILRCVAGRAVDDARSQGYTLAAQTTFSSLDDMKYYDNECEAHAALKAVAKEKVAGPPLMVFFDNAVGGSA
ncbi:stress responsive A/B barrel domain-containing protein [Aureobasidium namibiae CBS 147.97]|uniref:Stress responsive A/B barrel domain-containing protein n=1 Tax=Aureobasidium namibiae CBS 147.97 TaxID=1043004 RepID=A0A074XFJ3_9PEZI